MSYIINHPGSWKTFLKLKENQHLSLLEIKQKYLKQQLLFENTYTPHQSSMLYNNNRGGIKRKSLTPQTGALLTQNNEFILIQDGEFIVIN